MQSPARVTPVRWGNMLFVFLAACLCVASLRYAQTTNRIFIDEAVHVPQIQFFLEGKWIVHPDLTTIPGYHLVMAAFARALSLGVNGMRAMGLLFGLLAASAFYGIRKRLGDANALRSAALLFFLPILYPYYFLIYTDVLSLALVLCALWATLQNRHTLSAMVLTAAVLVRQNNVAWAALLPALVLWPKVRELTTTHSMPRLLRLTAPYAVPVLIFAIYWAWNGTISLSKTVASVHPDLTLHAGNLYYALLLCLALFPVEIGKGAKEFYTMALRRRWLFLIPIVFVAFANVRGSPDNYAGENYFIHNAVVSSIRHHGWARWLFAFSTAFAACGVSRTRFLLPQGWLIYPTAVFYLCSSWLIEGRYAIVPLAIWMALRQSPSDLDEKIRFAMWIATSQFIIWGILGDHFML